MCANVWVWWCAPARQHRATWTTSEAAARRVWHHWPHAGCAPALAAHQKDGMGPEMSVIARQSKEMANKSLLQHQKSYKESRVVKPVAATLNALLCKDASQEWRYGSTALGLMLCLLWHKCTRSVIALSLLQERSCFLGHRLWLSLLFLQVSGCLLQLVTCRMGWSQGFPYSSPSIAFLLPYTWHGWCTWYTCLTLKNLMAHWGNLACNSIDQNVKEKVSQYFYS